MSDKPHHRKPAAFKLDDPRVVLMDAEDDAAHPARGKIRITPQADPAQLPVVIDEPAVPVRKGFGWGGVFWTAARECQEALAAHLAQTTLED